MLAIFLRIPFKLLAQAALARLGMCLMVVAPRTGCEGTEWEGKGVVGLTPGEPRIGSPLVEGSGMEGWKHRMTNHQM